jgi:hypothetical protein
MASFKMTEADCKVKTMKMMGVSRVDEDTDPKAKAYLKEFMQQVWGNDLKN